MTPFLFCARHARWLLIAGLVAGVAMPRTALILRNWLPEMVALMLFLGALRIGPRRVLGALNDLRDTARTIALWQIALPLLAIAITSGLGIVQHPAALAVILMFAAAPLAGSPNLAMLVGADPAPALRLLILGTAALPLTVIPVFGLLPELGAPSALLGAVLRLLGTIALATGLAFAIRLWVLREPAERTLRAIDGASAFTMTVMVLGLMSAIRPALETAPETVLLWLTLAFAANIGPQVITALVLSRRGTSSGLPALSITAGNRNIALFLVALPPEITDQILLFIGCYQVPMYMTPLLLSGFYRARL